MTSWAQGAFRAKYGSTALPARFGDSGPVRCGERTRRPGQGNLGSQMWTRCMGQSSPQLPAVALNTNSNVPLRSLSRVHKQCRQPFCSLPSILPPPPPLSTSRPNYSPWMPAIVPTMTVTIFTHPSTFPIPTPPLLPRIQTTHSPPTIPQTFSTLPNQSISTHLMFRVQFLPSSPRNSTPRLNSQTNCPPLTLTTTPYNSTRLQPPTPAISVRRVHTSL